MIPLFAALLLFSCVETDDLAAEKDYLVNISTSFGDMKLVLFDDTPKHKASFIAYAKAGKYDSTTFHRVIKDFMIQGGNVNARPGLEGDNTLIDAEFQPNRIHTKGMLAAARTNNPEKRSGVQFYIVQGIKYPRHVLDSLVEEGFYMKCVGRLNQIFRQGQERDLLNELIELQAQNDAEGMRAKVYENISLIEQNFGPMVRTAYTEEQYKLYETEGGVPHLDGEYTVFGQVVEGIEVVDKIADQPTNPQDRPLDDIYMRVTVEEVSKRKLKKLYGVVYE